jgi:hypothetical protein
MASSTKPSSEPLNWGVVASIVGFMLVVLFTVWVRLLLYTHITDDSYISFRYADRLVAGQGLTFNDGEWAEGFSNPLWVLLLAALKSLTALPTPQLAQSLGLIIFIAHFAVLGALARKMPLPLAFFLFTSAWLMLTPGFQVYATLGLEGPLLSLLLLLGCTATLHGGRWLLLAAMCFGLAGVTRPEGPLYAALWGLVFAFIYFRDHGLKAKSFIWVSLIGLITLLPIIAYQLFRLHTYGEWVPNTALAKPPGIFQGSWLFDLWGPWLLAVLPALIALVALRGFSALTSRSSLILLAPILAGVVLNLYSGVDWMLFGRLLLPVWPLIIVLLAAALLRQCTKTPVALLMLIILASALSWQTQLRSYGSNQGMPAMLMRGHDQVKVGEWLATNFPAPTTVAIGRLGGVSYTNPQHTVWDLFGLTDKEQAQYMRRERWLNDMLQNPVMQRAPALVILSSSPDNPRYGDGLFEPLQSRYICLRRFKQGQHGTLDVWISRNIVSPVAPNCDFAKPLGAAP